MPNPLTSEERARLIDFMDACATQAKGSSLVLKVECAAIRDMLKHDADELARTADDALAQDSVTLAEIRLEWAKFQANECSVIANMDFVKAVSAALASQPAAASDSHADTI